MSKDIMNIYSKNLSYLAALAVLLAGCGGDSPAPTSAGTSEPTSSGTATIELTEENFS